MDTAAPWTSYASVRSDRAERYVKQLVSHLGRKRGFVQTTEGYRVSLSAGSCLLLALPDRIEITAEADTEAALRAVEDVVTRHLQRFGQRSALQVSWRSDVTGTAHPISERTGGGDG